MAQGIQFGLKSGLNLAKFDSPPGSQFSPGFNGGVFAQFRMKKFIVQPEILYSQQGSSEKVNFSSGGPPVVISLKSIFNYLNIPILAKLKLGNIFNLQTGPQLGFILVAKFQNIQIAGSPYVDVRNIRTDFSFAFGAGTDLPVGITIDARYNLGLITVSSGGNAKNQVIQLSVGYRFLKLKG
jgi:hypothetical protein